jgi:uncharacterized membrane protein YoaK (UPF0700 family)
MRSLALCYAALAGSVDAVGFMKSGGLFVSFMSGNSTLLAIGVARGTSVAAAAAALIALFVVGVALNVFISETITMLHRKVAATLGVAAFLTAAAVADTVAFHWVVIGCLCLSMGASNAIFRRDGEVSIGVTYMTGTLVRLGLRLADWLRGAGNPGWLPYLLLWLSLVFGGVVGALGFLRSPHLTLWGIAVVSVVLMGATHRLTSGEPVT